MSLCALLLAAVVGGSLEPPARYVFTDASSLWVTGTSTVHDGRCDATDLIGWIETPSAAAFTSIAGGEVVVTAAALECKNGTMNKKTRKALKADDHPTIQYTLTRAELVGTTEAPFSIRTTGTLTIAGEAHTIAADVRGAVTADGAVRLAGELPITMSTYGVDPPTAMLGALKTGDDVVVHFELVAALQGGS